MVVVSTFTKLDPSTLTTAIVYDFVVFYKKGDTSTQHMIQKRMMTKREDESFHQRKAEPYLQCHFDDYSLPQLRLP
jgi:hypothetical protein